MKVFFFFFFFFFFLFFFKGMIRKKRMWRMNQVDSWGNVISSLFLFFFFFLYFIFFVFFKGMIRKKRRWRMNQVDNWGTVILLRSWKKSYEKPRQHIKKQRHYIADRGPYSQSYGFPVIMYGCESWTIKKTEHRRIDAFELWCWKRLESPLDCKEIKPVNPKGNKS